MELAILIAYYLIIKSIGTTVGNTAALLRGEPVQVRRPARVAGGEPVVGPSHAGRAIGTVAAVAKESVAAGVATGWAAGKDKHAARQDKRAAKRAAKTRDGADAPVLDTVPAGDTAAAGGTAPAPPGAQEGGQPVLDIPAVAGEWLCRNCGCPAGAWHCEACRVCVSRATVHLPGCPVVERERWWAAQGDRDRARAEAERARATEAASQQPTPGEPPRLDTTPTLVEPADGQRASAGAGEDTPGQAPPAGGVEAAERARVQDRARAAERRRAETWQRLRETDRCCWPLPSGQFCGLAVDPRSTQGHCGTHTHQAPTAAAEGTERPGGSEERPGRGTVLFLVPQPGGGSAEATAESPVSPPPEQPAPAVSTPPSLGRAGGVMTTTVSAETTTIGATRAYLAQLAAYVQDDILGQLELADATLRGAEMDADTLGHLASAAEHFAAAKAAIESALATVNTKHAAMEEAVQSTPDAATRDYYRGD